jgi:hypothetical protein
MELCVLLPGTSSVQGSSEQVVLHLVNMGIQADCVEGGHSDQGERKGDRALSGPIGVVDRKCDGDSVVFETLVSAYMIAGFTQPNYTQSTQSL